MSIELDANWIIVKQSPLDICKETIANKNLVRKLWTSDATWIKISDRNKSKSYAKQLKL